jgi:hypothetical protein
MRFGLTASRRSIGYGRQGDGRSRLMGGGCTTMSNEGIEAEIRRRILSEQLPHGPGSNTIGGIGDDHRPCDGCGRPFKRHDVQYEVEFQAPIGPAPKSILLHGECHRCWLELSTTMTLPLRPGDTPRELAGTMTMPLRRARALAGSVGSQQRPGREQRDPVGDAELRNFAPTSRRARPRIEPALEPDECEFRSCGIDFGAY